MKKIIIREVWNATPGNASKLAKMTKEMMDATPGAEFTVMTDLVGNYNTVIAEYRVESLAEFEKHMEEMRKQTPTPEMMEKTKDYHKMYQSGRREVYKIVE